MKLFIAIELPKPMKKEISSALKELKIKSTGGRFVAENNLHITLHYIGESSDLSGAVSAMRQASQGIRPFILRPESYDFFEKSGHKTSFVTVGGQLSELEILHETLEAALCDNGFSRDYKRFVPHITLGRNVWHDEMTSMEMRNFVFRTEMSVQGITLFESCKENGKTLYLPLHREKF